MELPDYHDNSIVNLMASLTAAMGGKCTDYPPLKALPHEEIARYKKVMLWVIDGMGHDHLLRHRPEGFLARHVRARMTSVCPTTTASAITTFVSGKAPLQHGLTGWFTWMRELGSVATVLPFHPRGGGAAYNDVGISLDSVLGWRSIFEAWQRPSHALIPAYIADSHFSRTTYGPAVRHGFKSLQECIDRAGELLSKDENLYLYAYWSELDRLSHMHGVASEKVLSHLAQLDEAIEAFAASLDEDTLLLITADHGLVDAPAEHTLWLHDHPPLQECLSMPLCGEPRLAFCYVHADRRDQFLDYVKTQLSEACEVMSREEMLAKGLFGLGIAHPELPHRIGDFALIMKGRWIIKDRIAGESDFHMIGVHGGLSADEMYVPLIVRGTD
ncbi:MAG: alkaline phosphatase family protein [Gammaproteobacteria bacterium]|nr:alkaline phosphatase family protein [Gammaproteobacteria bacterium]